MTFTTLWMVELRRSLHRRVVWVLVLLALILIAVLGGIAFASSTHLDAALTHARGQRHPAIMVDWLSEARGDGVLNVTSFFLLMGALIGGAYVVGGEWRAGTVTTVLTWVPARVRLFAARMTAAVTCAVAIGFVLQVVALLALLPAVSAHGTSAGVDGGWYADVAVAIARISLLAGLATAVGASLAFIARNSAGAIVAVWAWLLIVEGLVRVHKPTWSGTLLGDNLARVVNWADLSTGPVRRSPTAAALTVLYYVGVMLTSSAVFFRRTDVAAG